MDQNSIIGVAALMVTAYGVFHTRKQTKMMEAGASANGQQISISNWSAFWRTPGLYALFLLVVLAWMPNVYDIIRPLPDNFRIIDYGIEGPFTFHATMPTKSLEKYKGTHRLMLVVRIPYGNIDRMRDQAIEKSITYTIDSPNIVMAMPGQLNPLKLRLNLQQPSTTIEYNAILVPNDVTPDEIVALSDIRRRGGRILDIERQIVPTSSLGLRPANAPPPQEKPCHA